MTRLEIEVKWNLNTYFYKNMFGKILRENGHCLDYIQPINLNSQQLEVKRLLKYYLFVM